MCKIMLVKYDYLKLQERINKIKNDIMIPKFALKGFKEPF